jgi:hypothetical protein
VALAAVERAPQSVLVYRTGVSPSGTPLVCFDGSDSGIKALDAGTSLQRETDRDIRVVLVPTEKSPTKALREEAETLLGNQGLTARFVDCSPQTTQRLCQLASISDSNGIVIGAENPMLRGEGLKQMLADAACPILLVR